MRHPAGTYRKGNEGNYAPKRPQHAERVVPENVVAVAHRPEPPQQKRKHHGQKLPSGLPPPESLTPGLVGGKLPAFVFS